VRTDALTQMTLHQGILNNLQDGGNTPLLLNTIDLTQVQDAYALYSELMQNSPYLSEEVLKTLAEKQNFPDAMLRDIMVANEHAGKDPEVLEQLQERATLPDYMLAQIETAATNGISAKEYLEAQIAEQQVRFTAAVKAQLHSLRTDTTATTADFLAVLDGIKQPIYRYQYINYLIGDGQTAAATEALENMATYCQIAEKEAPIYADYPALYAVLIALKQSNRPLDSLTNAEKEQLHSIAGYDNYAQAAARCLLRHTHYLPIWEAEPLYLPSQSSERRASRAKPATAPNTLIVFPNPATTYVTLQYSLTALAPETVVEITDATGKRIVAQPLKTAKDALLLNTADWANGVYICRIQAGNDTVVTQKLTINR
jgi:hypothetical protein